MPLTSRFRHPRLQPGEERLCYRWVVEKTVEICPEEQPILTQNTVGLANTRTRARDDLQRRRAYRPGGRSAGMNLVALDLRALDGGKRADGTGEPRSNATRPLLWQKDRAVGKQPQPGRPTGR